MAKLATYILPFLVVHFLSFSLTAQAQMDTTYLKNFKPEFRRLINHEAIDKEQKSLLAADGKTDNQFVISTNEEINLRLTKVITNEIDEFQYKIETDSLLDHRLKVNYLTGTSNILKYIRLNFRNRKLNVLNLPVVMDAYEKCLQKDKAGQSIEPVLKPLPYDVGTAILASGIFDRNPGYQSTKDLLILKYCTLRPAETFITLKDNPNVPFADSLVKVMGKKIPRSIVYLCTGGE